MPRPLPLTPPQPPMAVLAHGWRRRLLPCRCSCLTSRPRLRAVRRVDLAGNQRGPGEGTCKGGMRRIGDSQQHARARGLSHLYMGAMGRRSGKMILVSHTSKSSSPSSHWGVRTGGRRSRRPRVRHRPKRHLTNGPRPGAGTGVCRTPARIVGAPLSPMRCIAIARRAIGFLGSRVLSSPGPY